LVLWYMKHKVAITYYNLVTSCTEFPFHALDLPPKAKNMSPSQ
jgi:hypothetical protein